MTRFFKSLCLLSALALWQGCSSTSDNGDAASGDAAADIGVGLSRGMNYYKITAVTVTSDVCDIGAADFLNEVLPVNFVLATQILSVGNSVGDPVMPSLGSGVIGTMGTLMRENNASNGTACVWHQKDVSIFNLTGADVFTLDVTETQSQFTSACDPTPPGGTCTSVYKLTLSITTPPADAGA
ncbi:MAG TPA: hypothetical protein VFH68_18735 [Polyangia bacterium]|nr:hypothetical protein [Polyangia bacterium]